MRLFLEHVSFLKAKQTLVKTPDHDAWMPIEIVNIEG